MTEEQISKHRDLNREYMRRFRLEHKKPDPICEHCGVAKDSEYHQPLQSLRTFGSVCIVFSPRVFGGTQATYYN